MSSTGRSCRTYKQAKIDLRRGLEGLETVYEACKHPFFHPFPYVTLFPSLYASIALIFYVPTQSHTETLFSSYCQNFFFNEKSSNYFSLTITVTLHLDSSSTETFVSSIALLILACIPRGEATTGHPTGIL